MAKFKVVINEPNDFTGESYKLLDGLAEVIYGKPRWETSKPEYYSQDQLVELCRDADAVICGSRESFTRGFMEKCPKLRIISKAGIGTEKINVQAATELGVLVGNTPIKESINSVAEHTVLLILASLRKLRFLESHFRQENRPPWKSDNDPDTFFEMLEGKTIGLIGFGRIAQRVYHLLRNWDVSFLVNDPYLSMESKTKYADVKFVELEHLLSHADIVSLHVAPTADGRPVLDKEKLSLLKSNACLINTARGQLIDEQSLTELLMQKKIAGAGLDVFIKEPPDFSQALFSLDNVVLTPHAATQAKVIRAGMWRGAVANAVSALYGEMPRHIKNPEVIPRWEERLKRLAEA
jgi:D-3-phosphoglycerate dehydrogenase